VEFRLLDLPQGAQDHAEIVLRLGVIGVEAQRRPAGLLCLGHAPECAQSESGVAMIMSPVRLQPNRLIDVMERRFVVMKLVAQHPQQMQRIGIVGIQRQSLAIGRLRLQESPGLMMLQASLKNRGLGRPGPGRWKRLLHRRKPLSKIWVSASLPARRSAGNHRENP
jgi:hypothetical protein